MEKHNLHDGEQQLRFYKEGTNQNIQSEPKEGYSCNALFLLSA